MVQKAFWLGCYVETRFSSAMAYCLVARAEQELHVAFAGACDMHVPGSHSHVETIHLLNTWCVYTLL